MPLPFQIKFTEVAKAYIEATVYITNSLQLRLLIKTQSGFVESLTRYTSNVNCPI